MAENNWAIAIGINKYKFLPDPPIQYAVNDAVKMRQFLCERAKFPPENVLLCCDSDLSQRRPTRTDLRHLLKNEIRTASGADNFWFFYAGHGIVHERQDFLLPCDGNPDDLTDTAIPISFVTDCLRECGAVNVVMVMDMCRNRTHGAEAGGRDIGRAMGEQTLEIAKERGIVTLFSCSRGERSYEIPALEQGVFTYALLEGLERHTTPRALEQYLSQRVPALNREHGKKIQTPRVIPEPGFKYDRSLLLSCATSTDIVHLRTEAMRAELREDYSGAKKLWRQVIVADRSTSSEREEASDAIERISPKIYERQPASDIAPIKKPTVPTEEQKTNLFIEILPGCITLELVKIPAGNFLMGSNEHNNEKPPHQVIIQEFYLGKYPVTQEQWQAVMGNNPSKFSDNPQNPVEQVSWNDCQEFCQKLSQMTDKTYRLPSEAEWEYACRAGTQTRYYFGDNENQLGDYAWYKRNSASKTHPVGQKKPNFWGLYDMHGNVWEWCEDDWNNDYQGAPTDGSVWIGNYSQNRVIRGGSWDPFPSYCRSASRYSDVLDSRYFNIGFRVVCVHPRLSLTHP
ncbi:MAG: SUMF1/EgtB/PvdO family nonheme iron enzyme [Cyanobacteria bacterium RI_101]|nr:SUMF1/EgtB/PvdO family nonheme iron enzyme [Cyanobacteria bacterium RI_101]